MTEALETLMSWFVNTSARDHHNKKTFALIISVARDLTVKRSLCPQAQD